MAILNPQAQMHHHSDQDDCSDCWPCAQQPSEECLCRISRKDFVARATAFVESIVNASAPACCPWCFNLLSYEISRSSERVTQIQRTIPQFFEVCMRLLVLYADAAADIPRLRERLASNQRACSERSKMHRRRTESKLTDAVDIFLHALFVSAHSGLVSGKRPLDSVANMFKPHFYKRAGHWPTGLADLFPAGVEAGVAALVHWCCVLTCPEPFSVLSSVLSVARAVCMPHLLKSPTRERFIWAILHAVHYATVPWRDSEAPPFSMPRGLTAQRAVRGAAETVEEVLVLLNNVMASQDNRTHEAVQFVSGYEQLLLDALGPHLAARCSHDPDAGCDLVCDLLDLLRAMLGLGLPGPASDRPATGHWSDAYAQKPGLTVVRDTLTLLRLTRICGNAACGATELSEERLARFRFCEFCGLTRYCSRDCQKADWKVGAAGISHSMVCPILVKLQTTQKFLKWEDSGASSDYFMRAFEECDFDPRDADILQRWALACGVAPASRHIIANPPYV